MNNGYQEFSCGFFSHSLNFRVSGLNDFNQARSPIYEALKNLLERGYPTRPTHYLEGKIRELYPEFSWSNQDLPESMMLRPFKPNWDDTIKGFDEKRLFPARTFFNDLIDEHLAEYSFIKNLIVPECKFGDILVDPIKAGASPDWAVDFFLPCADLVIEIDGSQHGNEKAKVSDAARDRIFRKYGIRTHRIETKKINENSDGIRNYFSSLKKILDGNQEIQLIKDFINNSEYDLKSINYDLLGLARFQRLLVALLEQKQIKNGACLELKVDFQPLLDWPDLALKDLNNTYDLLKFYFPSSPKFPKIKCILVEKFSESSSTIKIDLSIFRNLDDTPLTDNTISVLNSQLNFVYCWDSKEPTKEPKICLTQSNLDGKVIKQKRGLKQNLEQLNSIIFGFDEFRKGQFEIISSAIESHSVLGLLPTGGGKSLCFQTLGAIEFGCTIVVCPITALIRDHVLELQQFGFNQRAAFVSAETAKEQENIFHKLEVGSLKFLFLSPEQFQKPEVRQTLARLTRNNRVSRFVIDEVHCISEWGHDFRTAYLNLAYTIEKFSPGTPVLCLTATAAVKVIKDIQIEFKISDNDIVYSMDQSRAELSFKIQNTNNKLGDLQKILASKDKNKSINKTDAMIIFSTRANDSRTELGVPGISQNVRRGS
jgi:ATP-dependent DNA helicase RecQ